MPEPGVFNGPVPAFTTPRRSTLVICGAGHSLMADLARLADFERDQMAINDVGMFLQPMRHWFSCHPERFDAWCGVRRANKDCDHAFTRHSKQGGEGAEVRWPIGGKYGQQGGHSAAIVAVAMGYSRVILAGVPSDAGGHFYPCAFERPMREPYDHGQGALLYAWAWLRDNFFEGRVKSLSGNTGNILGEPENTLLR